MKNQISLLIYLLCVNLFCQENIEMANQISLEEHIHSKYDVDQIFDLKSQRAKQWNNIDFEWREHNFEYKRKIRIGDAKYSVKLFKESSIDLYYAQILNRDGELDSNKSFYYTIKRDSLILYEEERIKRISEAASPIHRYKRMGYTVVSSSSSGDTTIVTMKNGNSYVTLTLYKGKLRSTSRHNF